MRAAYAGTKKTHQHDTILSVGHDHSHSGHGHSHGAGRALWVSLVLTVSLGGLQVGSAIAFDSLALAADAIHNLSDGVAVGLAFGAAWLARRPASGARTFGYKRAEVLAATVNAGFLIALSLWLAWESALRIADPPTVGGSGVAVVGAISVVLNLVPVILLLRAGARDNLNLNATMLHFAGDVLASAAAVVAGVVIAVSGWYEADGVAGVAVSALIIVASVRVLRHAIRVLLEVAPVGTDPTAIGRRLAALPGVRDVHDLHVWTIADGFPALATHVVVEAGVDQHAMLHTIEAVVRDEFGIDHATIQIDIDHANGLTIQPRLTPPRSAP